MGQVLAKLLVLVKCYPHWAMQSQLAAAQLPPLVGRWSVGRLAPRV
jgi:hypothetical protein